MEALRVLSHQKRDERATADFCCHIWRGRSRVPPGSPSWLQVRYRLGRGASVEKACALLAASSGIPKNHPLLSRCGSRTGNFGCWLNPKMSQHTKFAIKYVSWLVTYRSENLPRVLDRPVSIDWDKIKITKRCIQAIIIRKRQSQVFFFFERDNFQINNLQTPLLIM